MQQSRLKAQVVGFGVRQRQIYAVTYLALTDSKWPVGYPIEMTSEDSLLILRVHDLIPGKVARPTATTSRRILNAYCEGNIYQTRATYYTVYSR